jgi:hypothetical protein
VPSSTFSSRIVAAWPARTALATAAILVGYNLAVAVLKPATLQSFDAGLRNVTVAEHYLDGAPFRAVLTGSSMGYRLAGDFMDGDYLGPAIYNLSLAGKTALSGLDLVLSGPLPALVFVEMNTLDRRYDPDFAAARLREPWRTMRAFMPGFRVENRPFDLAAALAWKGLKNILARAGMAASEPVYSAPDGLAASGRPLDDQARMTVNENVELLERRIAALRQAGVRVVLLRLPSDPAAETASTRNMWTICYARFPPSRYEWLDLLSTGSYQTEDGFHLNKSSARMAATVLRRFADDATRN